MKAPCVAIINNATGTTSHSFHHPRGRITSAYNANMEIIHETVWIPTWVEIGDFGLIGIAGIPIKNTTLHVIASITPNFSNLGTGVLVNGAAEYGVSNGFIVFLVYPRPYEACPQKAGPASTDLLTASNRSSFKSFGTCGDCNTYGKSSVCPEPPTPKKYFAQTRISGPNNWSCRPRTGHRHLNGTCESTIRDKLAVLTSKNRNPTRWRANSSQTSLAYRVTVSALRRSRHWRGRNSAECRVNKSGEAC